MDMSIIAGYGLYGIFVVAVISMILSNINMVKQDTRKEERQKARRYARFLAEREFDRLVHNTKFKVTQKMVITNDSDIKW